MMEVHDADDFTRIWRELTGAAQAEQQPTCPIAAEFERKLEDLIFAPLKEQLDRRRLAQAKYLLQEEYQAWRHSLPRHRHLLSQHRCLDEVYHAAYDRLHLLDLRYRPPLNLISEYDTLSQPPPALREPPAPPPVQIAGIFLGEEKDA